MTRKNDKRKLKGGFCVDFNTTAGCHYRQWCCVCVRVEEMMRGMRQDDDNDDDDDNGILDKQKDINFTNNNHTGPPRQEDSFMEQPETI